MAKFLVQGHFAVSLFIVISGFCLMLPVLKHKLCLRGGSIRFFKKRMWRILPPYWAAFLLSVGLLFISINPETGSMYGLSVPISWETLISHLFVVHNLFGDVLPGNGVLWSIGVEWQIYFLFPIFLFSWRLHGGIKSIISIIFLSYALLFVIQNTIFERFTAQYVALFAFGMLAAVIAYGDSTKKLANIKNSIQWARLSLILFTVVASFCLVLGWRNVQNYIPFLDLFIGLSSLCLLVAASQPKHIFLRKTLSSKPLVFIGGFSYSLYLIHFPLLDILCQYVFYPLKPNEDVLFLLFCFVGLPIVLTFSYIFYLCVERPFMIKAQRI